MDSRGRVVTISGLRMEVTRFGELKIGHRVLDADEGDRVAETISSLTKEAYQIRRRPGRFLPDERKLTDE